MGYRPLGNRLLVKPGPRQETTKTGIVLPDSAREKPREGKVISAGPGKKDDKGKVMPMEVKTGDMVLYSEYGGTEIKIEGEDHLIVSEDDILAIVDKKGGK